MVEDHKKSENEVKVNVNEINTLMERSLGCIADALNVLNARVKALEEEIIAMKEGDNTGFKHENDGGWFD